MQKNGYTFATVYSSKCVSGFLHQTLSNLSIFKNKIIIVCKIDFERQSSIQKLHLKYFKKTFLIVRVYAVLFQFFNFL